MNKFLLKTPESKLEFIKAVTRMCNCPVVTYAVCIHHTVVEIQSEPSSNIPMDIKFYINKDGSIDMENTYFVFGERTECTISYIEIFKRTLSAISCIFSQLQEKNYAWHISSVVKFNDIIKMIDPAGESKLFFDEEAIMQEDIINIRISFGDIEAESFEPMTAETDKAWWWDLLFTIIWDYIRLKGNESTLGILN